MLLREMLFLKTNHPLSIQVCGETLMHLVGCALYHPCNWKKQGNVFLMKTNTKQSASFRVKIGKRRRINLQVDHRIQRTGKNYVPNSMITKTTSRTRTCEREVQIYLLDWEKYWRKSFLFVTKRWQKHIYRPLIFFS